MGYGVDFPLGRKTYGEIDFAAGRMAFSVTRSHGDPFIPRRDSYEGPHFSTLADDYLPPRLPEFYARTVDGRLWASFHYSRDLWPGQYSYTDLEIPFWFVLLPFAAFVAWGMFGRKQVVSVIPPSDPRFQQVVAGTREDVIFAAEQKLGRSLTEAERRGIESISSLMMLQSCCESFGSPTSTPAEVKVDLEHFAKRAQKVL